MLAAVLGQSRARIQHIFQIPPPNSRRWIAGERCAQPVEAGERVAVQSNNELRLEERRQLRMLVRLLEGDERFCETRHHARQRRPSGDFRGKNDLLSQHGRGDEANAKQQIWVAHGDSIFQYSPNALAVVRILRSSAASRKRHRRPPTIGSRSPRLLAGVTRTRESVRLRKAHTPSIPRTGRVE